MSLSLLASSSFLKSLVFCARSFLCVSVSRWCATRSEATVSSCGMSVVRSMSGAPSVYADKSHTRHCLLLHAPIAFWNLLPSSGAWSGACACSVVGGGAATVPSMSMPPSMVAIQSWVRTAGYV